MRRELMAGAAAGAAGTTALNTVTYLDMVVRARPASTSPEETVRRLEKIGGFSLSAAGPDSEAADNRRSGLGALLGIGMGVAAGVLYGVVRPHLDRSTALPLLALTAGAPANAGSVAALTALGVSDPRQWSATDWASDVIPHLAYGAVTALVFDQIWRRPHRARWSRRLRDRYGRLASA